MTALKDHLGGAMVAALAGELHRAWPDFPREPFVAEATEGLDAEELKGRIDHVASALDRWLPPDAEGRTEVLDEALRSPGFDGWMIWPCAEVLGRWAIEDPHRYLPLMARLTGRGTCEFAIRPCLERHQDLTLAYLDRWVDDPDEHVRRLVSEGTRPRLPWGARLRALQHDPHPGIALLDRLRDDPSAYVRRSVANHLGDIVKDHPDLAVATATRWMGEGGAHAEEVVRHGLRTLLKVGDQRVLRLLGYDPTIEVAVSGLDATPSLVHIGEATVLETEIVVRAEGPMPVIVEYVIHYLGVRGPRAPKAYRWIDRVVPPGEPLELRRKHTFAHASIRRLYPGPHRVEVQVNGRVVTATSIDLREAMSTTEPGVTGPTG